jgi:hypothetical protein
MKAQTLSYIFLNFSILSYIFLNIHLYIAFGSNCRILFFTVIYVRAVDRPFPTGVTCLSLGYYRIDHMTIGSLRTWRTVARS